MVTASGNSTSSAGNSPTNQTQGAGGIPGAGNNSGQKTHSKDTADKVLAYHASLNGNSSGNNNSANNNNANNSTENTLRVETNGGNSSAPQAPSSPKPLSPVPEQQQGWIQWTDRGKMYLSKKEKNVFVLEGTTNVGFAVCRYNGTPRETQR
jgi:hypothetical protein